MTLGKAQRLFVKLQAEWICWCYQNGYELSTGDGFRDPRVFGQFGEYVGYGRRRSNHKRRLAHDWNLFINGKWQPTTEAHRPLGEKWESMHPHCRWGGRYNDGNHYEFLLKPRKEV
jgi:hypothetical protein